MLTEQDKIWIKELFQEQLQQQLQAERRWVRQQLEKVETTLLTEFHKWASPQEMRQHTHAAAIRVLEPKSSLSRTG